MPEKPTFVVNDRRKFNAEGELRHEPVADSGTTASAPPPTTATEPAPASASTPSSAPGPILAPSPVEVAEATAPEAATGTPSSVTEPENADEAGFDDASLPAGPNAEQMAEAAHAYAATVDRLDTAMRAANPGGDRTPPMNFDRLVQSLYTQALLLLGGGTEPGETPRVDILGARQTIDMLAVVADKVKGNLSEPEQSLIDSALFDLRMGFLEITQALARQAAQRQPAPGGGMGAGPGGGLGGGPRIVR